MGTGEALVDYAQALDRAQDQARTALAAAQTASREAQYLEGLANRYQVLAKTVTDVEDITNYRHKRDTARQDADEYRDQISRLRAQVQAAETDRDAAAETAIARIEQVTSADGLNDSWWDKFAAVLQALARITEKIAMITGILALLFSWVPVLGPALLAVSALAGLISAVANLALAAGGKQSWTQAITSVLVAALGCVGLGGMRGMLGAVKGLSGLKTAIKSIGGLKGLATGTITHGLAATKSTFGAVKGLGTTLKIMVNSRPRFAGAGSGPWVDKAKGYIENVNDVVAQQTNNSCVGAVGEMLTHGALSQRDILRALSHKQSGYDFIGLPKVLGDGWQDGLPATIEDLELIIKRGDTALILKAFGNNPHAVMASANGNGILKIMDPWPPGVGSGYNIAVEDIFEFVAYAIFRTA
jgi:hypothetical protein